MNIKITLFTIFLLIAIGSTCWVTLLFVQKSLTPPTIPTDKPDSYLRDASYLKTDINGIARNKMAIPYAQHYATDDEYLINTPKLKIIDAEQQIWQIDAASGKSIEQEQIINLSGNVKIQQFANDDHVLLTISTDALSFHPKNKFAETKQPITIVQPGFQVQAVGAELDLNAGKLRLLSKVKVHYEPTKHK